MTAEQEALDLVMDITTLAKQGKCWKKSLAKLKELAKKDKKAQKIYFHLLESVLE